MANFGTLQPAPNSTATKLGIALVEANHRVAFANLHLCEMLERSFIELIGLRFEEFTHPEDVDLDSHLANRVFTGELESYEICKRFLTPAKRVVRAHLTATVARDQTGKILYGVALVRELAESDWQAGVAQTELSDIDRIRRAMLDA